MPVSRCGVCGRELDSHGGCPACYGRRCVRCRRPLFLHESVRFTAAGAWHIAPGGCARTRPARRPAAPSTLGEAPAGRARSRGRARPAA